MNRPLFDIDPAKTPTHTLIRNDKKRIQLAFLGIVPIMMGIWLLWGLAALLGWSLDDFGIRPRQLGGVIGILTAPLVHASLSHLLSNTLPLFLLGTLLLYTYPLAVRWALPIIWIGSGIGVWLFARPSVHIGISGFTHGLMFFLFLVGLLRRDRVAVTIAFVVFFLYGSMTMTVFPREPEISWEYHLAGALSGIIAAIFLRRVDPLPTPKKYSWDFESEEESEVENENIEEVSTDSVNKDLRLH